VTRVAEHAEAGGLTKPIRVQRKRTAGWVMPENTTYVGRPTKWGNPFDFRRSEHCWSALAYGCKGDPAGRREASVRAYRAWLTEGYVSVENGLYMERGGKSEPIALSPDINPGRPPTLAEVRAELRGKNLACWCGEGPCHAEVLLELANADG
jgi:hypothetical protein